MKHLFLLPIVLAAFFNAQSAHAAPIACNPVDGTHTASYNGVNVDNLDANTRHCEFTGNAPKKHNNNNHPATSTSVNVPTITHNSPTTHNNPVVTHETKKHCNNGNGNGSEGCNASDKGNQDETPQKGDKDNGHPTH